MQSSTNTAVYNFQKAVVVEVLLEDKSTDSHCTYGRFGTKGKILGSPISTKIPSRSSSKDPVLLRSRQTRSCRNNSGSSFPLVLAELEQLLDIFVRLYSCSL